MQAEEQGALVLWGHAYDLSVTPPYGPWLEIFRAYRAVLPPGPAFIDNADELAKVGSQETLFAAMVDFFSAVAAQRPLMLVLDDLHWADQASLDFFRYLARQVGTLPVLLVATYRSDELHRRHPLYSLLPLLVRESGAERLEVRPLNAAGHLGLIQSSYTLSEANEARLEAYLTAHAGGNPLYAGELLRALEEEGVLVQVGDAWQLGEREQLRVPPLLRQVIEGRLSRLDEETRGLLQVAAVIGQEVPLELWQQVSGASVEAFVTAIEQGQAAQLIAEEAGGRNYRFRHALLREALYEELIALRRRLWHRQIAETRPQLPHPDPDLVAYHYQQAGDPRAVEWLLRAGERASRAYAGRAAAERLEAVLGIYREQGRDSKSYYGLLFALGSLQHYASTHQTNSYLIEAAAAAREAGDLMVAALADAERGFVCVMLGEIRDGMTMLQQGVDEALRVLAAEPGAPDRPALPFGFAEWDSSLRAMLGARTSARVHFLADVGRLREALDLAAPFAESLDRAIQGGEPLPSLLWDGTVPYGLENLTYGLAVAYAILGHRDRARRFFVAAEQQFTAAKLHNLVASANYAALQMFVLPYHADIRDDLAVVVQRATVALQQGLGNMPEGFSGRLPELPLLVLAGRWQEAEVLAPEARGRASHSMLEQLNLATIASMHRHQGRHDDARRETLSLLPDGPQTEPGNVLLLAALPLQRLAASLALDRHDFSTARAWLEAHDRWLDWSRAVLGRAEGALLRAQYYHAAGDHPIACQRAEQALAHASEPRQPLALFAVHHFLGQLDTEAGEFDAAEEHLQQSLTLAEACGAPFERALTLLGLAEQWMAQDKPDEARPLLADVRAICEPLGARPTLERVATLEERLAGHASPD